MYESFVAVFGGGEHTQCPKTHLVAPVRKETHKNNLQFPWKKKKYFKGLKASPEQQQQQN